MWGRPAHNRVYGGSCIDALRCKDTREETQGTNVPDAHVTVPRRRFKRDLLTRRDNIPIFDIPGGF